MKIWDARGFIPFELETLTPVHIGSGEDLFPLNYVVRQPGENAYEIWLVDAGAWLAESHARPEIAKALAGGDMASLRSLLNADPKLTSFIQAKIRVAAPQLGRELLRKIGSLENKAEIMPFSRNPFTHMPYVPGSSIKGAISTAVTDHLNERRKESGKPSLREHPRSQNEILREMFGAIGAHAMQALKIADIALPPASTSIREAIGAGLAGGKLLPKTPCEALDPIAPADMRPYGNMRVAMGKDGPAIVLPGGSSVSAAELGKICNAFYKKRFYAEHDKFYVKPHLQETARLLAPICRRIDGMDEDRETLLRIGRYSHIECVTVSGDPPPTRRGCGTTRTLADGRLPFGWVILKQCDMAAYTRGVESIALAARKEVDNLACEAERSRERLEAAEALARQEAEAARERERELAAMPPEQRAIWELGQPEATESQASAVFGKLAEFGGLQAEAAEALMQFWRRIGKWEGKQLSKKQKEKVAAVRAILKI